MSGQWMNAPLAYVVGMVRFARMNLNQEKINQAHDILRTDFPQIELKHQDVQEISFDAEAKETSVNNISVTEWSLLDPSSTTGVLIRSDSVFLHTTAYENHKIFEAQIKKVLNALNSISPIEYVQSIGLRSIDVIQETESKSLTDCIAPELQPLNITDKNEIQNTIIQMEVVAENVALKCLCVHLTELPKERVSIDLMPLRGLLQTGSQKGSGSPAIILDTDCVFQQAQTMIKFDVDVVVDILENQLHSRASKAFKKATTDSARKEWKYGS